MSTAPRDATAKREIVDALQGLLVERQEKVLRLEELSKEEAALRKRLAQLAEEQEQLTRRLGTLLGPPEDAPAERADDTGAR